ncbi:MAG: 1-deoxy-D-xylulose-5-phosphate reductoisomerase [Acidobacteriota bacterium]
MKSLSLLGSTGSIGRSCLDVVREFQEDFRVVGLAAGSNLPLLVEQIREFQPSIVSVSSGTSAQVLNSELARVPASRRPELVVGRDGLIAVATHSECDFLVSAIVGVTGLPATYEAVRQGKLLALANKEIMVVAGSLITQAAKQSRVEILPVDSEHSAVHQCLRSGNKDEVRRIILTASGGPFLTCSKEEMRSVTPEMALKHPTWVMGNRITIDSATLMNKGFEVLEAHWLFGLPVEKISVLIHPQSTVHSMVEFVDGSIVAQLGVNDMRYPLQYAMTYPKRIPTQREALGLTHSGSLEFLEPDTDRFPCLDLAYRAAREQGVQPCTLNAADEVAVEAFLRKEIPFLRIPSVIGAMLDRSNGHSNFSTVAEILEYDEMVRRETRRLIELDYKS